MEYTSVLCSNSLNVYVFAYTPRAQNIEYLESTVKSLVFGVLFARNDLTTNKYNCDFHTTLTCSIMDKKCKLS